MSDFIQSFALVFTVFLIVIVAYYKWVFSYWNRRGVPTLNQSTLPFGDAGKLITKKLNFGEFFLEIYEKIRANGWKHAGIIMITKPFYIATDPDLIKNILQTDFQHFVNHGNYINEEADPLTGHLFSLEDAKWRNMRTKLTPTFTSGKMKMMFSTLANCTAGLKQIMDRSAENRNSVDIKDVLGRFTTDIIGSVAFGLDCNCLENPEAEFRKYGKKAFRSTLWQSLKGQLSIMIPRQILTFFRFKLTQHDVEQFFMKVVTDTVNYREKNNITRKDFLHLLLQLKNRGKISDDEKIMDDDKGVKENGLTMNEVAAQAFVFFLAGFETSSTTMTFALYELAMNQEIQNKLRKEINYVLSKHNEELSYDAIMEMAYMEQVICETLRKYPPASVLLRKCNLEYNVPNTNIRIEKGVSVAIPVWGLHNDPQYYPNPNKFDPDRFTAENKQTRPTFTWLPFGEGPRQCIGLRFGMMQSKVGLSTLLRNYRVSIDENKTHIPIKYDKYSIVLSVEGGVWLNVDKI